MSKAEKAEQIIPGDNANTDDKDNARNKSKSSSPLDENQQQHPQQPQQQQQQQTQCRQPARIVKSASQGSSPPGLQHSSTPEHMRGAATKDMFDLIERVQCSRLDDQRCVLPAYFSQSYNMNFKVLIIVFLFMGAVFAQDCSSPPDQGPCRALFYKWAYLPQSNICTQFVYGGCQGNRNRFDSKAQCESACKK